MKRLSHSYQAGIDLGSSKICCWVGRKQGDRIEILGTGHVEAQGIWGGHITNPRALEDAITNSLYEAERQTKIQVRRALLTLNGSFFTSDHRTLTTPLEGGTATRQDVQILKDKIIRPDFHSLHILPLQFQVDHQEKIIDPQGMIGKNLSGSFHILWMNKGRLQTLLACFKRCQIRVTDILFSAYSSAFACLSPDEKELGSALVDMGASSTSVAFFLGQKMVGSATIPIGGHHITHDIARGCETQISHAERLKVLYGAALATSHDYYETVPLVAMGEKEDAPTTQIPRSFLMSIIQARCEEILISLKRVSAAHRPSCQRFIFTGGASQLPGLKELAQRVLECPIRVAKPLALPSGPSSSSELSAVTGTFLYKSDSFKDPRNNKWSLFLSWLKKRYDIEKI